MERYNFIRSYYSILRFFVSIYFILINSIFSLYNSFLPSKTLKSRDLVLAYIERLKIVNETVNGLTQNNTDALNLAEKCDKELANMTKEKRNEVKFEKIKNARKDKMPKIILNAKLNGILSKKLA
ncbi:unnamed protein product [Meloidogyne enterolobii]|uniref:Uncharacterized protein n=1 Tax=Meloidogyne enterolobii TaxID=390850 RepID=A0ACB1AUM9_MELEN